MRSNSERGGWRIPVAFGLVLVLIPVGLYLRRSLPETLPEPKHASATAALGAVWRDHRRGVVLSVLVAASSTITTYVGTYMTTYAQSTLHKSPKISMFAPVAIGIIVIVGAPLSPLICERFGHHRSLVVSRVLSIALYVPAFLYLDHERSLSSLLATVVVLSVSGGPATIAAMTVMAEMFPTEIRSAGIALTYSLVVTLFGATMQFVVTWLLGVTHDPISPAYYVMAMSALSIVAMDALMKSAKRFTELVEARRSENACFRSLVMTTSSCSVTSISFRPSRGISK